MTIGGIVLLTIGGYNGITVGTVETADLFGDSEECTLQQTPLQMSSGTVEIERITYPVQWSQPCS